MNAEVDQIDSDAIREVVRMALSAGNRLTLISSEWKPRQVIFMDRPLGSATKAEITATHPSLEHFASAPTPHNPATEGFIDRTSDVAVAFPDSGETRRWYP